MNESSGVVFQEGPPHTGAQRCHRCMGWIVGATFYYIGKYDAKPMCPACYAATMTPTSDALHHPSPPLGAEDPVHPFELPVLLALQAENQALKLRLRKLGGAYARLAVPIIEQALDDYTRLVEGGMDKTCPEFLELDASLDQLARRLTEEKAKRG